MSKRAKAKQLSKDRLKCNKPKKTPSHKTKSHVVKACKDGKEKIIRFGQQGVKGAGKNPKSEKDKARKKSYYARHNAQDPNPDKFSARYWSHKTKSHVVKACKDGKEKIIRFGQQGVKGAGKNPKSAKEKARKKSYYARHNAQDPNPDKFSARYWSHKTKW